MAQSEDTELTDLVVEALEKNGSLAKIRALLRANIFLAFEDDYENLKQNESLDKVLLLPEGKLCLSIIHEFLNFCNLKNTLFVYKSETRQGREYTYDGENVVAEKLNLKNSEEKEPLLLTLIKNVLKSNQKNKQMQNDKNHSLSRLGKGKNYYSDDQNSTYIVNDDSSTTTSHSQSDNSSDEKNKLDLRLTLDNSDTDTSSGSVRGRNCSEYIVNNHTKQNMTQNILNMQSNHQLEPQNPNNKNNLSMDKYTHDLKLNNSSTDSTSYIELKPFNPTDAILLNTTGLPITENNLISNKVSPQNSISNNSKHESYSIGEGSNNSIENNITGANHPNSTSKASLKSSNSKLDSMKQDPEATDYSYDFTSPPLSARKDTSEKQSQSAKSICEDATKNKSNNSSNVSPKQNSLSSQSSVSLSDVADLISERSSNKLSISSNHYKLSISNKSNKSANGDHYQTKNVSDDSGDFSDSPIPSLSNLSLDIHSD